MQASDAMSSDINQTPWSIFMRTPNPLEEGAPTHVSLFSGAGGTDLGLHQAGFRTVFANDIDKNAALTFRRNLDPDNKIFKEGDITTIYQTISSGEGVALLTGGFPCQPFSNAGSRKGTSEDKGRLYQTVINTVRMLNPSFILLENVRGITTSLHEGKRVVDVIMDELTQLGYNVTFKLIDASDYGVPQRRLRLFIAASKDGRFCFPAAITDKSQLHLGAIMAHPLHPEAQNTEEKIRLTPQAEKMLEKIPVGGSWKSVAEKDPDSLPERFKKILSNMNRYHSPKFYRKFSPEDISGTVTASFTPENSCIWNPVASRVFTVRECARIQSFPDWFEFHGTTIRSKYKQIGNAIPPRLAFELGKAIKDYLNDKQQISSRLQDYQPTPPGGKAPRAFQVTSHTFAFVKSP
jgi:DNA (cytosine-5)-methyltransferase 1